jgi:outer membrane lipoprotein carrier protein
MRSFALIVVMAGLIVVVVLAASADQIPTRGTALAVVRAVEARYSHARTLEAAFYERYRTGGAGGQAESGTVYFSKPGRMRWEYESPAKKLFLVDGKNVWLYVPADHTASRASLKESADWRTPLALLTGNAHLEKLCGRIEFAGAVETNSASGGAGTASGANPARAASAMSAPLDPGDRSLVCLPRRAGDGSEAFQRLLLEVTPEDQLARLVIEEPGDIETEFRFGNWRENVEIPEVKFHFEPPVGVAIVDEQSLAEQLAK